jgi:hypothetical protein
VFSEPIRCLLTSDGFATFTSKKGGESGPRPEHIEASKQLDKKRVTHFFAGATSHATPAKEPLCLYHKNGAFSSRLPS